VPEEDITALAKALGEDGERSTTEEFGPRVKAWIANMAKKVSQGLWDVALETAPLLLASAISSYYGWT